jgi:hypothetical protein
MDVELSVVEGDEKQNWWGTKPLGLSIVFLNGALQVREVAARSPAQRARLKAGDVILAWSGAKNPNDCNECRAYTRQCQDSRQVASLRIQKKANKVDSKGGRPKRSSTPKDQVTRQMDTRERKKKNWEEASEKQLEAHRKSLQKGRDSQTPERREATRESDRLRKQNPKLSAWEQLQQKMEREKEKEKRVQQLIRPSYADLAARSTHSTPVSTAHSTPTASPLKKRPRPRYADSGASAFSGPLSFHNAIRSPVSF